MSANAFCEHMIPVTVRCGICMAKSYEAIVADLVWAADNMVERRGDGETRHLFILGIPAGRIGPDPGHLVAAVRAARLSAEAIVAQWRPGDDDA